MREFTGNPFVPELESSDDEIDLDENLHIILENRTLEDQNLRENGPVPPELADDTHDPTLEDLDFMEDGDDDDDDDEDYFPDDEDLGAMHQVDLINEELDDSNDFVDIDEDDEEAYLAVILSANTNGIEENHQSDDEEYEIL